MTGEIPTMSEEQIHAAFAGLSLLFAGVDPDVLTTTVLKLQAGDYVDTGDRRELLAALVPILAELLGAMAEEFLSQQP